MSAVDGIPTWSGTAAAADDPGSHSGGAGHGTGDSGTGYSGTGYAGSGLSQNTAVSP